MPTLMFISFTVVIVFSSLLCLSSLATVMSRNPIYGVLFLVTCYFNAASLLLAVGIEFVPVMFIVIYVGAIAILFLFVLLMINIKLAEIKPISMSFVPVVIALVLLFFVGALTFDSSSFVYWFSKQNYNYLMELVSSSNDIAPLGSLHLKQTNITSVGSLLFSQYWFQFIAAGLVLLVAMIASIVLTLRKQFKFKSQVIYSQIMTDFDAVLVTYE